MFVIGMWHEVSMRYLYWGLYHGMGLVVWQYWQGVRSRWMPAVPARYLRLTNAISVIVTVHFVWFSFVLINTDSLSAALAVYVTIFFGWM
jgi:alginate O-acetyltransferase complex protein AlgI